MLWDSGVSISYITLYCRMAQIKRNRAITSVNVIHQDSHIEPTLAYGNNVAVPKGKRSGSGVASISDGNPNHPGLLSRF
jgi:hypothetical protein